MLAQDFEKSRETLEAGMSMHPDLGSVVSKMLA
jgi:hypothetical protein